MKKKLFKNNFQIILKMNCTYNIYIYERYKSLKESGKAID